MKLKPIRTWLMAIVVFCALFALAACGQTEAPSSSPAPSTSSPPSQGAESSAPPTPAPAEAAGEEAELTKLYEAAKKEGKLVMTAEASETWRLALADAFQKKYPDIRVEYTPMSGTEFRNRMLQERKVGQYLWDLKLGGISPSVYTAKNKEGVNVPIRPLVLPEIADNSKWIGGFDAIFADNENEFFPSPIGFNQPTIYVNRDFVPDGEMMTPEDLLDPKFKGKIILQDPNAGAGLSSLTILLDKYGEQFIRDLVSKQEVVVTKDERQMAEWVIRGNYTIALGIEPDVLKPFLENNLGTNIKPVEGSDYMSIRHIQLLDQAPNPNAAKLYINWFLSKEGQEEISKISGFSSRRTDVPLPEDGMAIKEGLVSPQIESKVPIREKVQELVKELFK